jgi:hypothetical protein
MTDSQINFLICEITGDDPHWKCAKDYCNDLNAMHEAEKVLTDDQRDIFYPRWLGGFMSRTGPIYATARQRAQAFLRTMGKWEEAK